jgi:hypothetical protein
MYALPTYGRTPTLSCLWQTAGEVIRTTAIVEEQKTQFF